MKCSLILFCTIIFCSWFPYSFAMGGNLPSRSFKGLQNFWEKRSGGRGENKASSSTDCKSSAPKKSKHTRVRFGPKPKPRRKKPLGSKYNAGNAGKDPIWVPKYKYLIGVDTDRTAGLLAQVQKEDPEATVEKKMDSEGKYTYWITYSDGTRIGVMELKELPQYEYCQECPFDLNSTKLRPKFSLRQEEYWHTKLEHDDKDNLVRMAPASYMGKPIWTEEEPTYGAKVLAKILLNPKPKLPAWPILVTSIFSKTFEMKTYGPAPKPPSVPPRKLKTPPPRNLGAPPPMLSQYEKQINSGQMTTENPLFQLPKSLATNLFANQGLPPEAIAALKEIQTSSETDADDSSDDEGLNNLKKSS